jgi:hypothetical protein
MNDRMPLKIRLIAAGIHGLFIIYIIILLFLIIMTTAKNGSSNIPFYQIIFPIIFCSPLILIVLVITWIFWLITSRIHPFIDIAGRDAMNCLLNCAIAVICCFLFMIWMIHITCGTVPYKPNQLSETLWTISTVSLVFIPIPYFLSSMISIIFTFMGYRWKNRLIYRFVHD